MIFTKEMTSYNNHYELIWENPEESKFAQNRRVWVSELFVDYSVNPLIIRIHWTTHSNDFDYFKIYRSYTDDLNSMIDVSGPIEAINSEDHEDNYES
ncbi:MAG: hypothetical protein K8S23_09880 [Candidatus Cloacimonetes bacterium]|nr:hypothetical protein [Candidatus Cloacimonadota bacterium]